MIAGRLALALLLASGCRPPPAPFEEVTASAGLGGTVPCYDAALADYDGDGRIDVYVPNHATGAVLYRNLGGCRFEDVTAAVGLDPGGDQHGAGWGDADGDGAPDLYVALGADHGRGLKANRLYRQAGGRFADVGAPAGAADPRGRGRGVSWIDYDRDGDLDLFVANYATPNALFRNRGDGTFVERAGEAGLARPAAVRAVWTDYDGDGWPDVLFCGPPGGLRLRRNRGDGTFVDTTAAAGLPRQPAALGAAFGDADGDGDLDLAIASGRDYPVAVALRDGTAAFTGLSRRGETALVFEATAARPTLRLVQWDEPVAPDDPALALRLVGAGRWELRWRGPHALHGRIGPAVTGARLTGGRPWRARRPHRLFLNRGDGTFAPSAALARGPRGNGQAVVWGDVDDDGDLDLYVVQSGVEGADEPDALFLNDGGGGFTAAAPIAPSEDRHAGAHLVDLDGDGRLDLFLSGGWGSALARSRHRLLRNIAPAAHWLAIVPVGRESNRPGLGAWIEVEAQGRRQVRFHTAGALYAQDLVPAHFGLGAAPAARVTIRWPSGRIDSRDVPADRRVELVEGEGR
jgi:hypothetical protein